MKTAILWKNDYPWDVRIEKFALAIKAAGIDVAILCSNTKCQAVSQVSDGIQILRLPFSKSGFLNKMISSPFYLNPLWFLHGRRAIKERGYSTVIVRDMPLIMIGILLQKFCGTRLILDMAEDYPALYRSIQQKGGLKAFVAWFTKNPFLMNLVESFAIKRVDHIFVVVEESKDRIIGKGVPSEKISIISNTPDPKFAQNPSRKKRSDNTIRFIYCGFIQKARGLDTVIDALSAMRDRTDLRLIIVGDGYHVPALKKKVAAAGLSGLVEFKGWLKNSDMMEEIYKADIGIIPHLKDSHTDSTIPNKLFDYMACAKPVIVSNTTPMKRIVEQEQCGLVYESGNSTDLSSAMLRAASESARMLEFGENGRLAVLRKYNWNHDSELILKILRSFSMRETIC
jgi:glycosyltransferase involved in cell wall biosynthesis